MAASLLNAGKVGCSQARMFLLSSLCKEWLISRRYFPTPLIPSERLRNISNNASTQTQVWEGHPERDRNIGPRCAFDASCDKRIKWNILRTLFFFSHHKEQSREYDTKEDCRSKSHQQYICHHVCEIRTHSSRFLSHLNRKWRHIELYVEIQQSRNLNSSDVLPGRWKSKPD
jgi:hypothetical protein